MYTHPCTFSPVHDRPVICVKIRIRDKVGLANFGSNPDYSLSVNGAM